MESTVAPDVRNIKVFKLNPGEYWAGYTLGTIIDEAMDLGGGGEFEDVVESPVELDDEELDELQFENDDGSKISFRQQLISLLEAGETVPFILAYAEV